MSPFLVGSHSSQWAFHFSQTRLEAARAGNGPGENVTDPFNRKTGDPRPERRSTNARCGGPPSRPLAQHQGPQQPWQVAAHLRPESPRCGGGSELTRHRAAHSPFLGPSLSRPPCGFSLTARALPTPKSHRVGGSGGNPQAGREQWQPGPSGAGCAPLRRRAPAPHPANSRGGPQDGLAAQLGLGAAGQQRGTTGHPAPRTEIWRAARTPSTELGRGRVRLQGSAAPLSRPANEGSSPASQERRGGEGRGHLPRGTAARKQLQAAGMESEIAPFQPFVCRQRLFHA